MAQFLKGNGMLCSQSLAKAALVASGGYLATVGPLFDFVCGCCGRQLPPRESVGCLNLNRELVNVCRGCYEGAYPSEESAPVQKAHP